LTQTLKAINRNTGPRRKAPILGHASSPYARIAGTRIWTSARARTCKLSWMRPALRLHLARCGFVRHSTTISVTSATAYWVTSASSTSATWLVLPRNKPPGGPHRNRRSLAGFPPAGRFAHKAEPPVLEMLPMTLHQHRTDWCGWALRYKLHRRSHQRLTEAAPGAHRPASQMRCGPVNDRVGLFVRVPRRIEWPTG
jgi:hypothetical protein